MPFSKRRKITNLIVDKLKLINGQVSTFDSNYTYKNNIFNNAYRRLKFIDEINDFPSIYLQAGEEIHFYETYEHTYSSLPIILWFYVKNDPSYNNLDSLIEDIEHVLYHISDSQSLGIADITIETIQTDESLVSPYGIGEIVATASYHIEA